MTKPVLTAKGYGGVVSFDGQYVTIIRKGVIGRVVIGGGQKRIPVHNISSVQFKAAHAGLRDGWIEFSIPGGVEHRAQFGRQTHDAMHNENAVTFLKRHQPEFEQLRDAVEAAILAAHAPQQTPPDVVGQLQQLGQLRDAGVLTQEEFDAKKAELLGRL